MYSMVQHTFPFWNQAPGRPQDRFQAPIQYACVLAQALVPASAWVRPCSVRATIRRVALPGRRATERGRAGRMRYQSPRASMRHPPHPNPAPSLILERQRRSKRIVPVPEPSMPLADQHKRCSAAMARPHCSCFGVLVLSLDCRK